MSFCTTDILSVASMSYSAPVLALVLLGRVGRVTARPHPARLCSSKRAGPSGDGQDVRRTRQEATIVGPERYECPYVRRTSCPSRACRIRFRFRLRFCSAAWLLYRTAAAGAALRLEACRPQRRRTRCPSYKRAIRLGAWTTELSWSNHEGHEEHEDGIRPALKSHDRLCDRGSP
ncbi:MAG: hypothetical protein RLY70_145 [Planctomycetota bacterium]